MPIVVVRCARPDCRERFPLTTRAVTAGTKGKRLCPTCKDERRERDARRDHDLENAMRKAWGQPKPSFDPALVEAIVELDWMLDSLGDASRQPHPPETVQAARLLLERAKTLLDDAGKLLGAAD